ncbi:MAG: hypothetical protein WDZ50_03270 [Woeseia sp.]
MKASSQSQKKDKTRKTNKKKHRVAIRQGGDRLNRATPRFMLPALLALGGGYGFVADNAAALELGQISVQSTLGQPLRASIAYALGPNESIHSSCIFLRPAIASRGLPEIRNAMVNVSNSAIHLTGSTAVREPLLTLQLVVDCPYSANLSREYALFVEPSARSQAAPVVATTGPTVRNVDTVSLQDVVPAAQRTARTATTSAAPIRGESRYQVQSGDSLSGIASRISDRDISLWQAVDVIFAANPDAFINNDRNRLRAGSILVLPGMGQVDGDRSDSSPGSRGLSAAASTIVQPIAEAPATVAPSAVTSREARTVANLPDTVTTTAAATDSAIADTRQAAAAVDADNPFVTVDSMTQTAGAQTAGDGQQFAPPQESIADTRIESPVTPRIVVSTGSSSTSDGWGWLAWLGGSGVAIILGLLLFGRQLKDRVSPRGDRLLLDTNPGRRLTDVGKSRQKDAHQDLAITVEDFAPEARPVTLDADLDSGLGFDDDEIDLAQEFGFSTSRDLYGSVDIELTELATPEPAQQPTDIIPPKRFSESLILEKEIPPGDDTGEYDLSMIVDATRQSIDEEADTTKDLRAVQLDTGDNETLDADDYTLSKAVEYRILEQDYEAELTATQALNVELLKAAKAATARGDAILDSEAPTAEYVELGADLTAQLPESFDEDRTTEMPLNYDNYEPVTQELTAVVEPDDTGINAEITRELPAADNDATVEMDIETATVDTKKLRAS